MLRKIFICMLALACVGQAMAGVDKTTWINNDPQKRTITLHLSAGDTIEWIENIKSGETRLIDHWGAHGHVTDQMSVVVYQEIHGGGVNLRLPINDANYTKSTFSFNGNCRGYETGYCPNYSAASSKEHECGYPDGTRGIFVWDGTKLNLDCKRYHWAEER